MSRSLPARLAKHVSDATQYYDLPEPFPLENGEVLNDVRVAYRTWGTLDEQSPSAVLVCHALTASADADRWWPGLIGAGAAFDPAEDFVVCANILGSCYGTLGPASASPGSDRPYQANFPDISVRDMVHLQARLLDGLGVKELALVTGPSLGGMQALEWACLYPERVQSIVPIGVGSRHSPWCIGLSEAQRAAIEADPNWNGGYYEEDRRPERGLAAARMMAICAYRSWTSFESRFARNRREDGRFEVESYLRYQGDKFNDRFDANTYFTLTRAMHTHDLGRGRRLVEEVLAGLELPALVVSVSSDTLYPPEEQVFLAEHLGNARYVVLESEHGHDGFLIETARLAAMIRTFREDVAEARAGQRASAGA
ncbi:MAG: homoserine O-acetyltransferase [Pseudomonadota bacterium]